MLSFICFFLIAVFSKISAGCSSILPDPYYQKCDTFSDLTSETERYNQFVTNEITGLYIYSFDAVHESNPDMTCKIYTCLDSASYENAGSVPNYNSNHDQEYSRTVKVVKSYSKTTSTSETTAVEGSVTIGAKITAEVDIFFASAEMEASLSTTLGASKSYTESSSESTGETVWDETTLSGELPSRSIIRFYKPRTQVSTFASCNSTSEHVQFKVGTTMSEDPSITGILSDMDRRLSDREVVIKSSNPSWNVTLTRSNRDLAVDAEKILKSSNPGWKINILDA